MNKLILWDLDNTIVNSLHRSRHNEDGSLDIGYFNSYAVPDNVNRDHLIYPMVDLVKYFMNRSDCYNIVITSRFRGDQDKDFFDKRGLFFDDFLYRGHALMGEKIMLKNVLSDFQLKDLLLEEYLKSSKFELGFGFDDKPENLKVFADKGFTPFNANDINHFKIDIAEVQKAFDDKYGSL